MTDELIYARVTALEDAVLYLLRRGYDLPNADVEMLDEYRWRVEQARRAQGIPT